MSRQGVVKAGRPCIATGRRNGRAPALVTDGLCQEIIPIVFYRGRDFFITTGFSESSVTIENDRPRVVRGSR